jgi:serine/threonine-protein kinase
MTAPNLIGPNLSRPTPTPSASSARGFWRRPHHALPADLLRDASRRLGIVSLLAAVLWVVAALLGHVAFRAMLPGDPRWKQFHTADGIGVLAALASVALFLYTRRSSDRPQRILDLGHVYMVFLALTLGLSMFWEEPAVEVPVFPMITWAGAMVLMFAAIVPSTPLKTLMASYLAVSMMPVGLMIARARGLWQSVTPGDMLLMHYPDYMLAGVAVLIAHVVTGLGQQVAKAREMGSYRLGELLGRGGMGEVYKASHRLLARPAAIKLIRADVITAGDAEAARLAVRRFRREAEAAARLTSPHTVALYDFGVTGDQTLFLVMELLHGKDLQTLVDDHGPLPPARAVHVLRQICESLDEAHATGLVHRDIKPANIHVGRVGTQYDYVKVLDFGLVKSVPGGGFEESLSTAAAITPGTPAYLPPEAALGATVDARSDLYSLGCVAYFMLTKRLVFEADTAMQMIARHLRTDPVPPSEEAPFRIPAALDRVVLSCLAKKPEDRPASAAELSRALAATGVEPWTQAKAREWWRVNVEAPQPEPVSQHSAS